MQDLSTPSAPSSPHPPRRSRGLILFVAVIAFLLGGALVALSASSGLLGRVIPTPPSMPPGPPPPIQVRAPAGTMAAINSVEGRLALIEDRIARVDFQSHAASGNAARAEGMLIAFAARRLIDRGEPLGTVADQLRLRFTQAQPSAVQTVVGFAQRPVTLDALSARLEALSPELAAPGNDDSLWDRARHQFFGLFTVRRDSATLAAPSARIARARLMLGSGRIDQAIAEVKRLPGADSADVWISDARRYEAAQSALDLLETTAMLEPARLNDAQGQAVTQPSPLAPTAPAGEPTEAVEAE